MPQQISKVVKSASQYIYNGIDRLDPSGGYTEDNCVTACGTCNNAKMAMTRDEFLSWVRRLSLRWCHDERTADFKTPAARTQPEQPSAADQSRNQPPPVV